MDMRDLEKHIIDIKEELSASRTELENLREDIRDHSQESSKTKEDVKILQITAAETKAASEQNEKTIKRGGLLIGIGVALMKILEKWG